MRTGSLRSSEVAKPDFKGREAKRLKYDLVALRGVELRPEVAIESRELSRSSNLHKLTAPRG